MIEVLPVPQAAIDITPNQVDILNPQVWVEYLGDQDVDCYYNFGDGNGLKGAMCNTSTKTAARTPSPKPW